MYQFSKKFINFYYPLPIIFVVIFNWDLSGLHELTYLDLKIKSENSVLNFSVYDKRDDFSFDIVNFPFIDSCIPKKSALGVFYSQLIRYARLSSKYADFLIRSKLLVIKLMTQGYRKNELKKLTSRFFRDKQDILTKYNIPNIEDFLKSVFD